MDINQSVLTHSQGEVRTVLSTEWKSCLLKRLHLRRVTADNSPNSWTFFPIPPSWLRNGELLEEKFRLVDQIESRGDRANPVNIYQPLSPKLGPFLYVRRCSSYSIWRVPRPDPVIPQDTHLNKSSGDDPLIIHKMTPHLAKRIRAQDADTLRKISSVSPKTWERMKQLPLHIWDVMIALEPDKWNEFMKSVSTEQINRNGSLASDTPANRPRDRGDGAACRPSRIPLPIWRLPGTDPALPRPTSASKPTRPGQKGKRPHRRQRKAHAKRTRLDETIGRVSSSTKMALNAPGSSSTWNELTYTKSTAGVNANGLTATDCSGEGSISQGANNEEVINISSKTANDAAGTYRPTASPTGLTHRDVTDTYAGSLKLDSAVFCHPWQMEIPVLEPGDVSFRQEEPYDELVELGDGRFSTVYLADLTLQQEHYLVAVKKFTGTFSSPDDILREARITKFLADTGFVPQLFGCIHPDIDLVQECYGQGTTLEDLLSAAHDFGLPSETWLSIATQLALGLREFFNRGFLHNDIKSENILVDWTAQGYPIKYIDFGRATYLTGYLFTEDTIPLAKKGHLAPELWFGNITSRASDIFSLGRVLYSIAQAGHLWQIGDIAMKCVKPDPASRPNIDVIIRALRSLQRRLHQ